jgi:uncharacterized phage-like protein YoqJ
MILDSINFTGHIPKDLGGYNEKHPTNVWIKRSLARCILTCFERYETQEWISGGALGVDQWAAEIILWFKKHRGYPFYLVMMKPFRSQHINWNESSQERFLRICDEADEVVECQPDPYAPWKMDYRNKEMVRRSKMVIAVWNGKPGGTGNCVKFAHSKKRPILRIDPLKEKIFWEREIE